MYVQFTSCVYGVTFLHENAILVETFTMGSLTNYTLYLDTFHEVLQFFDFTAMIKHFVTDLIVG